MTEENININSQLTSFLKNLITSIEDEKLTSYQLRSVGEFYMSYLFNEQANIDSDDEDNWDDDFQSQDFIKFVVMGWYIYKIILADKCIDKIEF